MCKQSLEPKAFIIQNSYHAQPWCGLQAYPEFVAVLATTDPVLCSSLQQCETAPSPVLYTEKNTFIGRSVFDVVVQLLLGTQEVVDCARFQLEERSAKY